MGRLHSKGKGISSSAIPYSRAAPSWLKTTPEQVVDQICKLAKKGATPSQIGVVLRDSHGIAQVKVVTGMFLRCREMEALQWTIFWLTLKSQVTEFCESSNPAVRNPKRMKNVMCERRIHASLYTYNFHEIPLSCASVRS